MRVYIATTPQQIKDLLSKSVAFDEYLTPAQFEFDSQVDEEQQEHLVSLLAADDAIDLNGGGTGYVLAADLSEEQLQQESFTIDIGQVASVLQSDDGNELNWYSVQEIKHQIDSWIK